VHELTETAMPVTGVQMNRKNKVQLDLGYDDGSPTPAVATTWYNPPLLQILEDNRLLGYRRLNTYKRQMVLHQSIRK
jgi:hypothetical protein